MIALLFLFLYGAHGAIYMEAADKLLLEANPIEFHHIDYDVLKTLVDNEYTDMRRQCTLPNANIEVIYDESLVGTSVLAWASQYMNLEGRTWKPSVFARLEGIHFRIGVNPSPPNGWHVGDCRYIRYQYDLRTVIRHEILHGVGLGSSIRYDNGWNTGVSTGGFCFPRLYDTFIVDENNNKILDGCSMADISNKKLYIGGVELYHPPNYVAGSSLSHHNYPGHLFYYKSMPDTCMYISKYEADMLGHLGVVCSVSPAPRSILSPTASIFSVLCTLFLLLSSDCPM